MAETATNVYDDITQKPQGDVSEAKAQPARPYIVNNVPKDQGWAWMVMLGKYFYFMISKLLLSV